jgi:hypothetical protein
MYPHERSLVKKMEGRAFALIGVNSDRNKADLKQAMVKEQITWRSFWNGGSTSGPISAAWRVQAWPTLCILDHKGIIRHRFEGSPGDKLLDDAIEKLVREADLEANR